MPKVASEVARGQTFVFFDLAQLAQLGECDCRVGKQGCKENLMLDAVMLALGLGFFVLAVGYAYACERL